MRYSAQDPNHVELTIGERKAFIEREFTLAEAKEVLKIIQEMEVDGVWVTQPNELMHNIAKACSMSPASCIKIYYKKVAEAFAKTLTENGL